MLPANGLAFPTVLSGLPDSVADALTITKPSNAEKPPFISADHVVVDSNDDIIMEEANNGKRKGAHDDDSATSKRQKTIDAGITVKEEPVNMSVRPGLSTEMDDDTSDAFNNVLMEMLKTFTMLEEELVEFADVCLNTQGIKLDDNVDLIITDPPYNIRKEGGLDNASHDTFSEMDMTDLGEFCMRV